MITLALLCSSLLLPPAQDAAVLRERAFHAEPTAGPSLVFKPFENVEIVLLPRDLRTGPLGGLIFEAGLQGEPEGWARFVLNSGALVGDIVSPSQGAFSIRPRVGGGSVVRQIDRSLQAGCAVVAVSGTAEPVGPLKLQTRIAPVAIDLMVVYTPSAIASAGGEAALQATIESYVAYSNGVYLASGVHLRLNLVHAQEVAYVESGNSLTDIARLKDKTDGFLDEVHPLRDAVAADLVTLIATSGSAGVGYLMDDVSPSFEDSAFSTVGHDAGGIAFIHELGHNMGAGHNNGPGAADAAYCDSYGYRTPDDAWRTIMSSSPGEFVDLFSSPALTFAGLPLGVAGCSTSAADNVRTFNETAAVVAAFRQG